jgi:hypothetical protein
MSAYGLETPRSVVYVNEEFEGLQQVMYEAWEAETRQLIQGWPELSDEYFLLYCGNGRQQLALLLFKVIGAGREIKQLPLVRE